MRVLLLVCSILLLRTGLAQQTFIGVKAGGNIGSAFIDHTIFNLSMDIGFDPGIHGGVFFKYFPKSRDVFIKSGLQASINYVEKGWKQNFITDEPQYSISMKYLEIPIEGIGYFGNKNKYFVTAGFFAEFLIANERAPDPNTTNLGGQNFYTYEPERDSEFGYGGRMSVGMFREFSFGMLHLEGFFTYSFSNFIDSGDLTDETPDISNLWTAGVSLGYLISLGKKEDE